MSQSQEQACLRRRLHAHRTAGVRQFETQKEGVRNFCTCTMLFHQNSSTIDDLVCLKSFIRGAFIREDYMDAFDLRMS